MIPLSKKARDARKPIPPEYLIEALNDLVHIEAGSSRPVKPYRYKRLGNIVIVNHNTDKNGKD